MQDGDGKDTGESANAGVRFPPPLIFFGMMLIGFAADSIFGLYPAMPFAVRVAGHVIGALALVVIGWALLVFRQAGNDPEPWRPDAVFVAKGIYRFTRNPMYLGMALFHLGIALAFDSLGVLLTVPVAVLLVDRLVITREERHLQARFGATYEDYCRNVRRWL